MSAVSVGLAVAMIMTVSACTSGTPSKPTTSGRSTTHPTTTKASSSAKASPAQTTSEPPGQFTISFAGDVHFMERTAARLAADPSTVFAQAASVLSRADLTMVNLETAITTGGDPQNKLFTFRAPPIALTALRDAGIDVATMANNHGADYGATGLQDSLAAIARSKFPVIGIGKDDTQAFAPYKTEVNGTKIAIFAADQVQDETTLRLFSAGPNKPGVANAFSPRLISDVRAAKRAGYVVIVYLHWGTEYTTCPNSDQRALAGALAGAGAAAVVGTHAHVLQGAGWRSDGTYVAYGLGNYLWWRTFGNNQDDNGVLTLTVRGGRVVADNFAPAHLDDRGVPLPATGSLKQRIATEWNSLRGCADLSPTRP